MIRLGCWAAESGLHFVPKVFDDFYSPLVDSTEKESMICFSRKKKRGRAHTRLVGGNSQLVGGNIRIVCPSTQETRRSQLTIVEIGNETRSFKCKRPPLFNWGCGTRNPTFLPRQVGGQSCDPRPKFLTWQVVSKRTLLMCIINVLLLTTRRVKNMGCGSNTPN